jgi:uncharacterized protein (DUF1697 family)
MPKYIAFLRAINVGGNSIIKMVDLKRTFESFGLENVQTFIQSGNVFFESKERSASVLEEQIERQMEKASGKRIQIFVRTIGDVVKMVSECPFHPKEGEVVHVTILDKKPSKKNVDSLMEFCSDADDFFVKGNKAFNLRHNREKSIFSNHSVEQILAVPGTTRNLNTIKKLAEKYA